jgi:hypothetical protein
LEGKILDGQQWNMVGDREVQRLWRRIAVPGEGPANMGI